MNLLKKGRKMPTRKGKLRKILQLIPDGSKYAGKELLECGHVQWAVQDIYGETVAVRRRCIQCRKGIKPQFEKNKFGTYDEIKKGVITNDD